MRRHAIRPFVLLSLASCCCAAACAFSTASRAPAGTPSAVTAQPAPQDVPHTAATAVTDDTAEAAPAPPAAPKSAAEKPTTATATAGSADRMPAPSGAAKRDSAASTHAFRGGAGGMRTEDVREPESEAEEIHAAQRARSGLQGGSKDDVGQRQDYLKYVRTMSHLRAHKTDVAARVLVRAQDDLEQPLPNARVHLEKDGRRLASFTTYADGRAQFFPRALGLAAGDTVDLVLEAQGTSRRRNITLASADQELTAVVPVVAQRKAPTVDVMFVLDTTGSMGDEIARIQLTLLDVAARIHRLEPSATVRYGLTLYRDHGDAYVTQVKDFTTDVPAFLRTLEAVDADGGGDTPEALDEGLGAALTAGWTPVTVPNAVRVAVLVADAPPHVEAQGQQRADYVTHMRAAAERGIKIFPVAASGLDDQGEFIFRQVAHHTMARFVFITYGGGTSHHVGQFANNNLDDLVVGLVADEMADVLGRPRSRMRALALAR